MKLLSKYYYYDFDASGDVLKVWNDKHLQLFKWLIKDEFWSSDNYLTQCRQIWQKKGSGRKPRVSYVDLTAFAFSWFSNCSISLGKCIVASVEPLTPSQANFIQCSLICSRYNHKQFHTTWWNTNEKYVLSMSYFLFFGRQYWFFTSPGQNKSQRTEGMKWKWKSSTENLLPDPTIEPDGRSSKHRKTKGVKNHFGDSCIWWCI